MERILEIVRAWQSSQIWVAIQQAIADGRQEDLSAEQRKMDHILFRAWVSQCHELRKHLRENAPTLLKLLPPVDWSNDLQRCNVDDLTRQMVELEGELLAMASQLKARKERGKSKPLSNPGRKSNTDRDIKLWHEYREGLDNGRWYSQAEFARAKNVKPNTMTVALKRGEAAVKQNVN